MFSKSLLTKYTMIHKCGQPVSDCGSFNRIGTSYQLGTGF